MSRRGLQLIQVLSITWRGCPRRQLFPRNRSLLFDFPPARRAATSCNANRERKLLINKQQLPLIKTCDNFYDVLNKIIPQFPLTGKIDAMMINCFVNTHIHFEAVALTSDFCLIICIFMAFREA